MIVVAPFRRVFGRSHIHTLFLGRSQEAITAATQTEVDHA